MNYFWKVEINYLFFLFIFFIYFKYVFNQIMDDKSDSNVLKKTTQTEFEIMLYK